MRTTAQFSSRSVPQSYERKTSHLEGVTSSHHSPRRIIQTVGVHSRAMQKTPTRIVGGLSPTRHRVSSITNGTGVPVPGTSRTPVQGNLYARTKSGENMTRVSSSRRRPGAPGGPQQPRVSPQKAPRPSARHSIPTHQRPISPQTRRAVVPSSHAPSTNSGSSATIATMDRRSRNQAIIHTSNRRTISARPTTMRPKSPNGRKSVTGQLTNSQHVQPFARSAHSVGAVIRSSTHKPTMTRTASHHTGSTSNRPALTMAELRDLLREYIDNGQRAQDPLHRHHTDERFVLFENGEQIDNGRFVIISKLGFGEFSTVWLAHDTYAPMTATFLDAFVAIKATRLDSGAEYEAQLLHYVYRSRLVSEAVALTSSPSSAASLASASTTGIVELRHSFYHTRKEGQAHVCIVLPVLGPNLLCWIDPIRHKRIVRTPTEIALIRHLTRCVVNALSELDALNIVHTDLKPENILCSLPDHHTMSDIERYIDTCQPPLPLRINKRAYLSRNTRNPNMIKLTDFGLSYRLEECDESDVMSLRHTSINVIAPGIAVCEGIVLQTREYRAPEIILDSSFGCRTDVWSVGCIAYELITGNFLLDPKVNAITEEEIDLEHLAMMSKLIGEFPKHFLTPRGREPHRYMSELLPEVQRRLDKLPIRSLISELVKFLPQSAAQLASDFIMRCLQFDPMARPKARELARHPWVAQVRVKV